MLSISVGKNQSRKRGALYILTYEYNYKVIIKCDTGANAKIQRDIQL